MQATQEIEITRMRRMGESYGSIADTLGISLNTVKSFCRRNALTGRRTAASSNGAVLCAYCGAVVAQTEHRKLKKYCSDTCRMKWWDAHRQMISPKTRVTLRCLHCDREFADYASAARKYCCHECYIKARFGGGVVE